jgi:hypothetical protein
LLVHETIIQGRRALTVHDLTPQTLFDTVLPYLQAATGAAIVGDAQELSTRVISRGTRTIYLMEIRDGDERRRIIIKHRPARRPEDRERHSSREDDTVREYKAHEAAYLGLRARVGENSSYLVPRPLAVIPDHGLLCMEVCPGRPLCAFIRPAVMLPWKRTSLERMLERCGIWLKEFKSISLSNAADPPADEQRTSQTIRRRPYIYALLGWQGPTLVQKLVDGARLALQRYQYDPAATASIIDALHQRCTDARLAGYPLVAVHGKYSTHDVFVTTTSVGVVDLENSGCGTSLNDLAFLVYELFMVNRWNMLSGDRGSRVERCAGERVWRC